MSLDERLERLESLEEIRQLPAKYAIALDMRDWDAVTNLFVEDVRVGRGSGRQAFKAWLDATFRRDIIGSSHVPSSHVIDLATADTARGIVYSRNDLETEAEWVMEVLIYHDWYERRNGRWYFVRRRPMFWYQCDLRNPPLGPDKRKIPGRDPLPETFHQGFPAWPEFWADPDGYAIRPVTSEPDRDSFIENLTRHMDH